MTAKPSKYVRFDNGYADIILAFPHFVEHESVSGPGTVVSAGFIEFDAEGRRYRCFGESVSLGLAAREEDSTLASKQLPMPV